MNDWRIIAVTTPILFVTYQALTKLLPKNISVFLVNTYASLIGAGFMLLLHYLLATNKSAVLGGKNLLLAVLIGFLISSANFLIIRAYTLGAPQTIFTSLFYPVLIVCGVVAGLLVWHEKLNAMQILGIVLSIVGIILVGYFKK